MTREQAAIELMIEARKERGSTSAAKRVVRACKVLGLSDAETRDIVAWLDYCDQETGAPFHPTRIERVWP